ncbi:EAL domain-containing protein [Pseudidiomarina taiwanensis]|uniref:GGDEF domain-containing protein n=1 Tax=Pseudidiomarina taiwanensis TaxID=337250 RepID=A0A432ZJU6_9GAMM|nr:EAL domain-containing protein [Pseudidiomarina taiwanensis]RUO78238.1 hypothetical protein CWI83_04165 [Pseudidiomarina taiwanensis]
MKHFLLAVSCLLVSLLSVPAQAFQPSYDEWQVELITLRLANQPIDATALDARNRPQLYNTETLYLPEIDKPFSIEFGAPYAPNASQLYYRYKLEGVDQDWIFTDASFRRATYTNLPFGQHSFRVSASIDGQLWLGERAIILDVARPLWLSYWAIALYLMLAFAIIYVVVVALRSKRKALKQLRDSEERLKLSLWGSGDLLWDWDMTTEQLHCHNSWRDFPEFPLDQIRHKNSVHPTPTQLGAIHPNDRERVRTELEAYLYHQSESYESTYRVRGAKGWVWVLDRGKIVARDEQQRPLRMTGTLKDITPLVAAEERLKMLAASITNISDGVCIYDEQFRVVETNQSFTRITGYQRDEIVGSPLTFKLYNRDYLEQVKAMLALHGTWHSEIEDLRKDGLQYQMDLTIDAIRDDSGTISHYVATFSDITDRKHKERELRRLANTDTLTGLPNRSYFQVTHSNLVRKRIAHALLVFDLDDFKKINDSLGHEVGDHLLLQAAERISDVARAQDTVYRIGGDEFALLLEDTTNIHTITQAANRILDTLRLPFNIRGEDVVISGSIGIVVYPADGETSQELLQNADTAMYHTKSRGGNAYHFFNESMNRNAVRRLHVESQLRHALKHNYLQVHYQAKVSLKDHRYVGLEALVRLDIPGAEVISPAEFIPLAEETGLIIDVGERVLRQTCRDMRNWIAADQVTGRVAVNLSARQFLQPDLTQRIKTILAEEGLPPHYLELEITEGVVMENPERAIQIMSELHQTGIHLALDDFGTGYSSLAYLKRFPIQTLKIDKAFIDDIHSAERDRNMVASIVGMAHNLGLSVVAEGVVDYQQAQILAGLNCEYAQGYLYAQPLSGEKFLEHISTPLQAPKSYLLN